MMQRGHGRATQAFAVASALSLGSGAAAQSFNIDIDANAGSGAGVPTSLFAGAANRAAVWTDIPPDGAGPYALVNSQGDDTGVMLTRSGTFSGFSFDNANSSGDFEKLMDDSQSTPPDTAVVYTIDGLIPGRYLVYTYAIAPDSAVFITSVDIPLAINTNPQNVGGAMPVNDFVEGVTHARHEVQVGNDGQMVINAEGVGVPGSVNGIQIKYVPEIVYVNSGANGNNDGASWTDAFESLSGGVSRVDNFHEGQPTQIWVAQGTYFPSARTNILEARSAVFTLPNNASLYGGFFGDEMTIEERDVEAHPTILDGDLGIQDDVSDNAYNVVRSPEGLVSARLDGFTVCNANNTLDECAGGCAISSGGGIDLATCGEVFIAHCIIEDNNAGCGDWIVGCGDTTAGAGGGVYVAGGTTLSMNDCTLARNTARFGGGVYVESTVSSFIGNCRFLKNMASLNGGGISAVSNATVVNSYFGGNFCGDGSEIQSGAAIGGSSAGLIVNCAFVGNSGPGDAEVISMNPFAVGSQEIENSIIWGNPIAALHGPIDINNSIVEGGATGTNIKNVDPMFVDANGADGIIGTIDDRPFPFPCSPAVDAGSAAELPNDDLDLDGDEITGEILPVDLFGRPRVSDIPFNPDTGPGAVPVVDMGPYETQPGDAPGFPGDADGNGTVDFSDINEVLNNWLVDYSGSATGTGPGDADANGVVNFTDVNTVLNHWLETCS